MPTSKMDAGCYTGVIGSCTCLWWGYWSLPLCCLIFKQGQLGDSAPIDLALKHIMTLWTHVININLWRRMMDRLTRLRSFPFSRRLQRQSRCSEVRLSRSAICPRSMGNVLTVCLISREKYWHNVLTVKQGGWTGAGITEVFSTEKLHFSSHDCSAVVN